MIPYAASTLLDPQVIFEPETFSDPTPNRSSRLAPETPEPKAVPAPLDPSLVGITDAILKSPESLDQAISERGSSSLLVGRLLALSLAGFVLFGIAMSLVFSSADTWPQLLPLKMALKQDLSEVMAFSETAAGTSKLAPWLNGRAFKLIAAYCLGLIGATGICLPSLYFYGLLAGVRMSMRDVVLHALKAKATSAVALVGILPVYAAFALGVILFNAAPTTREFVFHLGLSLPFIAGLAGCKSLYHGFGNLPCDLPLARRGSRICMVRRLVLSWSVVFTAISPVMIHELWAAMSN